MTSGPLNLFAACICPPDQVTLAEADLAGFNHDVAAVGHVSGEAAVHPGGVGGDGADRGAVADRHHATIALEGRAQQLQHGLEPVDDLPIAVQ